jgi:hypothetical protein
MLLCYTSLRQAARQDSLVAVKMSTLSRPRSILFGTFSKVHGRLQTFSNYFPNKKKGKKIPVIEENVKYTLVFPLIIYTHTQNELLWLRNAGCFFLRVNKRSNKKFVKHFCVTRNILGAMF